MGQTLRTVDCRSKHLRLRPWEVHPRSYSGKDTRVSGDFTLCTSYYLPFPYSWRSDQIWSVLIAVLHHRRRSSEPCRIRDFQETDRHQADGRLRTDWDDIDSSYHALDGTETGKYGIAQSTIWRGPDRQRRPLCRSGRTRSDRNPHQQRQTSRTLQRILSRRGTYTRSLAWRHLLHRWRCMERRRRLFVVCRTRRRCNQEFRLPHRSFRSRKRFDDTPCRDRMCYYRSARRDSRTGSESNYRIV